MRRQELIDTTRDDRLGALFATALYTGMRQGELLGLRWPDVDLDAGTLRVRQAVQKIDETWQFVEPKSANGRRTVPLVRAGDRRAARPEGAGPGHAAARGSTPGPNGGSSFPSAVGTPLDSSNVTNTCNASLDAAALPRVTFHCPAPYLRLALASGRCAGPDHHADPRALADHTHPRHLLPCYHAMFDEAAGALARALGGCR